MLSMKSDASIVSVLQRKLDPRLSDLIRRRRDILGNEQSFSEMAQFVVVEPGDTIDEIERAIDWPIRPDPDCGIPQWEWILVHEDFALETVIVTDDAGYAIVLFVQIAEGMDPELMGMLWAFCS